MGLTSRILETARSVVGIDSASKLDRTLAKAGDEAAIGEKGEGRKSLAFDPFDIMAAMDYRERPSQLTYTVLEAMSLRIPILAAIIQNRVTQVAEFSKPVDTKRGVGIKVMLRDRRKSPTASDLKKIKEAEAAILACGTYDDPTRDGFRQFMSKLCRDSLIFDQAVFEVEHTRNGKPAAIHAVDAKSIRVADLGEYGVPDLTKTSFVQVYDDTVIQEFTQDELAFLVRNPRSDLRAYSYGISEPEMILSTLTNFLWAMNYNSKFFTQGTAAHGILNIKGPWPERQLRAFRRQWYAMLSGVNNAWRTPITNAEDLQWINMSSTARDMEFSNYMDFLIKIVSAVYLIDPAEFNFNYANSGASAQMFESPNKQKLTASRDRGLRPLMTFFQDAINDRFVSRLWPDLMLKFTGIDERSEEQDADLYLKQVKAVKTVDEIRAEEDLPPLPDGKGQILLDPTFFQYFQFVEANKQQAEEGDDEGQDGQDGEDMADQIDAFPEPSFGGDDESEGSEPDYNSPELQGAFGALGPQSHGYEAQTPEEG